MVIVLIRRSVRPDKEREFLASYTREKPHHDEFIDETLTRLNSSTDLPESLRSLPIGQREAVTYLNVARWKSAKGFEEWFKPQTTHDPEIETADRQRAVLDVKAA